MAAFWYYFIMKVISELKREEFEEKFKSHRDFEYFSRVRKHCYLVALTKEEYENLKMNSSPRNPSPAEGDFPTVKESIEQFMVDSDLLNQAHPDRGVSGTTVAQYVNQFKKGAELKDCFIVDDAVPNSYYICEGMHRLTAYGLYKKLDIHDYEVRVYYLTDKDIL